jgi:hypothetical protein
MIRLSELLSLHSSFHQYRRFPLGNTILHHFALPPHDIPNFKYDECYAFLLKRSPSFPAQMNHSSQDARVFQRRFHIVSTDNNAYRLLTAPDLSVKELEELSYLFDRWSSDAMP